MKKRILFVGENPLSTTGNGNMLAAILSDLDHDKYQAGCLVVSNKTSPANILFDPLPYTIVDGSSVNDDWGIRRLIALIQETEFDFLCMVGVDFWRYLPAWDAILDLRRIKKFKWISIFPYDLWNVKKSWIKYLNDIDFPCVYSQYGYDTLKPFVSRLRYYRPRLNGWESFKLYDPDKKLSARKEVFSTVPLENIIFGFIGHNQVRKSPERIVKAFLEAKKEVKNITLYLHTEMGFYYNLKQIAQDCGAVSGDMVTKQPGVSYARNRMPAIYNAIDCLVNCSMQEGLSWTPLEAMLCGTPVIASRTTAQAELIETAGIPVECTDLSFVPMTGSNGELESIESKACKVEDIRDAIIKVATDDNLRTSMSINGKTFAKGWIDGVSNINDLLRDCSKKQKQESKIDAVLFAQHSSAGDVLMTTQCFKGIKERHPGLPLVYMTQKVFAGVVFGNPYIDEIIEWNERLLNRYSIVYNPHGEHILHGGFNSLDVTLYSMYPYFCKVEADDIFINPLKPDADLPDEYIVVHTSGGSKEYRTYPHMDMALKNIGVPVVQLGGATDLRCKSDLDLRGKLTWQESAWVMKHAKAAVVIDSFLSHLAGAVGTNAVVLYGPAPPRVVGPKVQGGKVINLKPDMLKVCKNMTHCWGRQSQCKSPCINTINPISIRKALDELCQK